MPQKPLKQPSKSAAYCKVCSHDQRHRIELALSRRVPLRQIAREFGVSKDSAVRHRQNHMPEELEMSLKFDIPRSPLALDELRKAESENLLQTAVVYRSELRSLLAEARESGHIDAAARVFRILIDLWEKEARLLGELHSHTKHITTNITLSPEFMQLRVALVRSLERHPEAQADVLRVLTELERGAVDAEFAEVAPARLTGPSS